MSCCAPPRTPARTSTLPPPCYHCKPPPFFCPQNGCPPPQECPTRTYCLPPYCKPLTCRLPPTPPSPPPSICIAGPCPERPGPKPYCLPKSPKSPVPPSCVRFCIHTKCGQSTYSPCYFADSPKCPRTDCN